jgi:hypothetical protein
MMDWLIHQLENFNVITIIVMITFVTNMSKANTTKQLKAQSEEFYKEAESIRDEIRGQHNSLSVLIQATRGKEK